MLTRHRHATRSTINALIIGAMIISGLLPLAASAAQAADGTAIAGQDSMTGTISVSGSGTVTAAPDAASVIVGIESRSDVMQTALDDTNTRAAAVRDALLKLDIADDDIVTAGYDVKPIQKWDDNGNNAGLDYYQVATAYQITIRDIDSIGTVIDTATNAGADYVGGVSMFIADPGPLANQARDLAMADARARAETYAEATNSRIVGVASIYETSAPTPASRESDSGAAYSAEASDQTYAPSAPISTGNSSVSVSIDVTFFIVPADN